MEMFIQVPKQNESGNYSQLRKILVNLANANQFDLLIRLHGKQRTVNNSFSE